MIPPEKGTGTSRPRISNKKIALLIAVIALFLAFSETLGKSAQTAGIELEHQGVGYLELLPGQNNPPGHAAYGRRRDGGRADGEAR